MPKDIVPSVSADAQQGARVEREGSPLAKTECGTRASLLDIGAFEPEFTHGVAARSNVAIYQLGQYIEVIYLHKLMDTGGSRTERGGKRPPNQQQEDYQGTGRRARTKVRRLCLAHDLHYLWTLTSAAELPELSDAWSEWKRFTDRARWRGLMPKYWVCVPELQEQRLEKHHQRAWHFHFATNVRLQHKDITKVWKRGFTFVTDHGSGVSAAGYVAKYVGKSIDGQEERQAGQHRYRASDATVLPSVARISLSASQVSAGDLDRLLMADDRVILSHSELCQEGTGEIFGEWYLAGPQQAGGERKRKARASGAPPKAERSLSGPEGMER